MQYNDDALIKDVVAEDFRAAAIFQRYGLDFCCGGGKPIAEACKAKGVDPAPLLEELNAMASTPGSGMPRFDLWDVDMLADYIVANHHRYVADVLPSIVAHAEKVARVHGPHTPDLVRVAEKFTEIARELTMHMEKEEQVLFPYIKSLAQARRTGKAAAYPHFRTVSNPIRMMEAEHQSVGDEMAEIRELTGGYVPPMDACATYRVLFQELSAFEEDLHMHVHLENNILFPKAIALEEELRTTAPAACEIPA